MARRARIAPTGSIVHVVNRGVERRRLFYEPRDYQRFIELLARGKEQHRVRVLGVCIMPNHYHALLCPDQDRAFLVLPLGSRLLCLRISRAHAFEGSRSRLSTAILERDHFRRLPPADRVALHREQSGRRSTRDACGSVAVEQSGAAAAGSQQSVGSAARRVAVQLDRDRERGTAARRRVLNAGTVPIIGGQSPPRGDCPHRHYW